MLRRAGERSISVPVTLLLATRDRIIDNTLTRSRVEKLAGDRLSVVEINAAHTMDFEEDCQPYLSSLLKALTLR
jgi:hypothetical protein